LPNQGERSRRRSGLKQVFVVSVGFYPSQHRIVSRRAGRKLGQRFVNLLLNERLAHHRIDGESLNGPVWVEEILAPRRTG